MSCVFCSDTLGLARLRGKLTELLDFVTFTGIATLFLYLGVVKGIKCLGDFDDVKIMGPVYQGRWWGDVHRRVGLEWEGSWRAVCQRSNNQPWPPNGNWKGVR